MSAPDATTRPDAFAATVSPFRQTEFYPNVYVWRLRRYGHRITSCDRYTPSREDLIFHLNASIEIPAR
jgi:hypothetical protein